MERRLAAILAADVVGYSRMMGEDEVGTLTALKALRQELFAPKVAEHHGRIVKLMDDVAEVWLSHMSRWRTWDGAIGVAAKMKTGIREWSLTHRRFLFRACGVGLLALGACASPDAPEGDVKRTWDAAEVSLFTPDGQGHWTCVPGFKPLQAAVVKSDGGERCRNVGWLYGQMGSATTNQLLSELPADAQFPTVIYLHGCSGPSAQNGSLIRFLNAMGFAVIAPNSFARTNRPKLCYGANNWLDKIRMEEIDFALDQLRLLSWVDQDNLFLIGHSEGGEYAARYNGPEFKGRVASGAICFRGQGHRTPLLVIRAQNDRSLRGLTNMCSRPDEFVRIRGTMHWVWAYNEALDALRNFLMKHSS